MNMLSTSNVGMTTDAWLFLGFFFISIIAMVCSIILIKYLVNKQRNYKFGFENVRNKKNKYNRWNLLMVVFVLFTGFIGALITGGIFIGIVW